MLEPWKVSCFYINSETEVLSLWNLSRKHIRIQTTDRFIKLNKFRSRFNRRALKDYCVKFSPVHVYMSVLDWLFPERVGKKYKGNYAVPVGNGEFVVDVDAYTLHRWHTHTYSKTWNVCKHCLGISKAATILTCLQLEWYYSNIHIVFSGQNGFHIHVRDFDLRDWTHRNYTNLIKTHEVARAHGTQKDYSHQLALTRKYATRKLQNPRLLKITFHTLRHWKGTMEYHKTKDILHVAQVLGHKNIKNTMIYINLGQALFHGDSSEYTTRVAKTVKGARALLEAGFEYVTDMDGLKLFRRRK